jgi:hypothetical protein
MFFLMTGISRLSVFARGGLGIVLLGLIAVASTSQISHRRGSESLVGSAIFTAFGTAAVLIAICGLLVVAYVTGNEKRRRGKAVLLATAAALLTGFIMLLWLVPEHDNFYPGGGRGACPQAPDSWYRKQGYDPRIACASDPSGGGKVNGAAGGGEPSAHLLEAVAGATLLVLLVAGAAGAILLRRRRPVVSSDNEREAVLDAVDDSLDDLRRERDVRRAIIACYSRMEKALAGSGTPRQPHEGPIEFLARVLERVAREPGRALTELFERAKFSAEPMDQADKDHAITALEALRARLV